MFLELERLLLLTISYCDQFAFALNSEEVLRRIPKKKTSLKEVELALASLVERSLLFKKNNFYALRQDSLDNKIKLIQNSRQKLENIKPFVRLISKINLIKAIVVTGSVAAMSAKENDDVDFLIITQKDALWIVRPLVLLLATIFGKRRDKKGDHRDNAWCFNMWLDEDSLKINEKNIYTAYELLQAKFVFDKSGIKQKLFKQNQWIKTALPNAFYAKTN